MEHVTGKEISVRRGEYLTYIYECGGGVKTTELASHFAISPSTATKTLAGMAESGFLVYTPYYGVSLSPRGEAVARFFVRRHRLLSLVLSRFGLSDEEACREAKTFEGYVSKEVVDRICESLGHPMRSACGRIEHDKAACLIE